ncbi:MAG: glycosyltransferase [Syntrophobacteraceae bacterium]
MKDKSDLNSFKPARSHISDPAQKMKELFSQNPSRPDGSSTLFRQSQQDARLCLSSVKKPLKTHDDPFVVVGRGTITMRNGVDLFLCAAAAVTRLCPSRRFDFVWLGKSGGDLFSRYLQEQIVRCGLRETVRFVEESGDFHTACAAADMFFLSARFDRSSKAAIEALSAGLPVVCFENASGLARLFSSREELKNLVVPYMDIYSAAAVIDSLSNDRAYSAIVKRAIRDCGLSFSLSRASSLPWLKDERKSPVASKNKCVLNQGLVSERASRTFPCGPRLWEKLDYQCYDRAYQIWKKCRHKDIERDEALRLIGKCYGIGPFFSLYLLYKLIKPIVKLKTSLTRHLRALRPGCRTFDPSKKTILLFSHEASLTGAPLIAFNLLEKLVAKYNVVTVLLGSGILEKAFLSNSVALLGPFGNSQRDSSFVNDPILDLCRQFSPSFAIVNSLECCQALVPLRQAGVPSLLLVHEFVSLCPIEMGKLAANASQMVFPARLVWQNAVDVFPQMAARQVNILNQGLCRVPLEWCEGGDRHDGGTTVASAMRPLGAHDDAIVVIGCGTIEMRKGVDLFISAALALKRLSPTRRFRFVWVGKVMEHYFSGYLAEQIQRCGLEESIKFLGELDSVEQAYAMADIFFLSSRLDPFPNVAIEAMNAGLPVVCFENGSGIAQMLSSREDLKSLVVPYMDVDRAARIMELLSADPSYLARVKCLVRSLALSFDMGVYCERIEALAKEAALLMPEHLPGRLEPVVVSSS